MSMFDILIKNNSIHLSFLIKTHKEDLLIRVLNRISITKSKLN